MGFIIFIGVFALIAIAATVLCISCREAVATLVFGGISLFLVCVFIMAIICASNGGANRQQKIDEATVRIEYIDILYENMTSAASTNNVTRYVRNATKYEKKLDELRELVDESKRGREDGFMGLLWSEWYKDIEEELDRVFNRELPEFEED